MISNNFPHSELLNSSQKVLMQLGSLQEKHWMFLKQLGIKQLQIKSDETAQFLNKPYVNEVFLTVKPNLEM